MKYGLLLKTKISCYQFSEGGFMKTKKLWIFVAFVLLFLFCFFALFFYNKAMHTKQTSTQFANDFLHQYYSGAFTVRSNDDVKQPLEESSEYNDFNSSSETGIYTTNTVQVTDQTKQLFTTKALQYMISNRLFAYVSANNKDCVHSISLKLDDTKDNYDSFSFTAKVDLPTSSFDTASHQNPVTITGQLSIEQNNGEYRISRFYAK